MARTATEKSSKKALAEKTRCQYDVALFRYLGGEVCELVRQ